MLWRRRQGFWHQASTLAETLDQAAQVFLDILAEAKADPESLHQAPRCCPVGRPDEVTAARSPILRYSFGE